MSNLKDHFNQRAHMLRKRREAQRKLDTDFALLLLILAILMEEQRRLEQAQENFAPRAPTPP